MPFLILFLIIPIIEVYGFVSVGKAIGTLETLLLCIATGILGVFLVRTQGMKTLMNAQNNLRTGKMPLKEVFDGFCIVVAGAFLVTPGFFTDIIGFLLLFSPFRSFLQDFASKNGLYTAKTTQKTSYSRQNANNDVIDGDYERMDKTSESLDHENKND